MAWRLKVCLQDKKRENFSCERVIPSVVLALWLLESICDFNLACKIHRANTDNYNQLETWLNVAGDAKSFRGLCFKFSRD